MWAANSKKRGTKYTLREKRRKLNQKGRGYGYGGGGGQATNAKPIESDLGGQRLRVWGEGCCWSARGPVLSTKARRMR